MSIERFIPAVLYRNASKDSHDEGREEGADIDCHQDPHPESKAQSVGFEGRGIAEDSAVHKKNGNLRRPGNQFVADLGNVEGLETLVRETLGTEADGGT